MKCPPRTFFEKLSRRPQIKENVGITDKGNRAKGSGSVKKRERIRKRDQKVIVFYEAYQYGSDGRRIYGSGPTARKAEVKSIENVQNYDRKLVELARQVVKAHESDQSDLTVGEMADRYVKRKAYEFNSLRKYRGFVNVLKNPAYSVRSPIGAFGPISGMKASQVEFEQLADFIFEYRSRWSENSTYNLQIFLRQVFKYGLKRRWVHTNPAEDLDPRKKTPKVRIPMPQEVMNRLVDLCEHPRLKAFLLLSTYALRSGEIAGLTSQDIVGNYTLQVRRTQAWMENDLRRFNPELPASTLGLSDPKSQNSVRPIVIHPDDWWIIEQSLELASLDSVLTYDLGRVERRFIIPNSQGGQWRSDHIRRALRKFLFELEDEEVKGYAVNLPHTWRVSVITNLIDGDDDEEGMSLAKVSRFAGHSRVEITGNIYYKSTVKAQKDVSAKIGERRHRLVKKLGPISDLRNGFSDGGAAR